MKPEQYDKLKLRHDELIDVAIVETDPRLWPADEKQLAAGTRKERGDRYWCKKNAAATLTLITKIESIINTVELRQRDRPPENPDDEDNGDLDRSIAAAEAEATAIIDRFRR